MTRLFCIWLCFFQSACSNGLGGLDSGDLGVADAEQGTTISARLCGRLLDVDEIPVEYTAVIVCRGEDCFSGESESNGGFCVYVTKAGAYLFHAKERKGYGTHYGDVMFPVYVSENDVEAKKRQDLGNIIMPKMGDTIVLDPDKGGELLLGNGVTLNVPAGVTVPYFLLTTTEVAVAKVEIEHVNSRLLNSESTSGTPLAAYLFVPVGTAFLEPIFFELLNSGITGEKYLEVFWANEKTGILESHTQVIVDSSGTITPQPENGLKALGWFVFYEK